MGFSFGKGKESSNAQNTQSSRVVLPDYLQGAVEDTASRVGDLSLRGYSPYEGQAVAGFSPLQQQAFGAAEANQGQYSGLFDSASQMIQQAGQGVTPEGIQSFMNPYQQNVIDISKREALSDYDRDLNQLQDQEMKIGAFGGSRTAIAQEEARNNLNQNLGDLQYRGQADNYNQALGASFQNVNALNQSGQNLYGAALAGQQYNAGDVNSLLQAGGLQQANEQAQLGFDLSQFQEGRQWDYDAAQFGVNNLATLGGLTRGEDLSGTQEGSGKSSSFGLSFAEGGLVPEGYAEGGLVSFLADTYQKKKEADFVGPQQPKIGSGEKSDSERLTLKDFLIQKALTGGNAGGGGTGRNTLASQAQGEAEGSRDEKKDTLFSMLGFAEGGMIPKGYAEGGDVSKFNRLLGNVGRGITETVGDTASQQTRNIDRLMQFFTAPESEYNKNASVMDKRLEDIPLREAQEALEDPDQLAALLNDPLFGPKPSDIRGLSKVDPEPLDAPVDRLGDIIDGLLTDEGQEPLFSRYSRDPSKELLEAPEQSLASLLESRVGRLEDERSELSPGSAFMAEALANSQKGLFGAIGSGLQGYNKEKYISEDEKFARKQQGFDNTISQINSNSNKTNAMVAQQNADFKARAFPLAQQEQAAKVSKLQAEAAQNPLLQKAIELYDPASSFGEDPETVIRQHYLALQKLNEEYGGNAPQATQGGYQEGDLVSDEESGKTYEFLGGEPSDPNNWKEV